MYDDAPGKGVQGRGELCSG